MSNRDGRINELLKLAEEVRLVAASVEYELLKSERRLSFREKTQLALGRKVLFVFDALVDDAQKNRAEAMHHLKTVVESFIYFNWIGEDENRARLIKALMCKNKLKFLKANLDYAPQEVFKEWEACFDDLKKGLEEEWKAFKDKGIEAIAKECELEQIYNRIYRLACEPAHLNDLLEFEGLYSTKSKMSGLWAFIALDYGIFIVCSLLEISCGYYKFLDTKNNIIGIRERHNALRSLPFRP